MKSKLTRLLIALAMVLPFLGGLGSVVNAAGPDQVDVTIHKLIFEEGKIPTTPIENEGGVITPPADSKPLPGAEFTIYDVTGEYHRLRSDEPTMTQKQIMERIQNDNKNVLQSYATVLPNTSQTPNPVKTVAPNGTAKFTNLPKKDGSGKAAAYLILETNQPTSVKQIAHPMVMILPAYNKANKEVTDIHLYPKNEKFDKQIDKQGQTLDKIELTVPGTEKKGYNVAVGDFVNYEIKIAVPLSLDKKEYFFVKDTPDTGLVLDETKNKITIAGLTEGTDYDVVRETNGKGFTIRFFGNGARNSSATNALKALQGQYLTIKYDMRVTQDIVPDSWIGNTAEVTVKPNNEPEDKDKDDGPKLKTGGYIFKKEDDSTGKGLAGAEFNLVIMEDDVVIKYAKAPVAGVIEFSDDPSEAQPYKVTAAGILEIKGLKYSGESLLPNQSYAVVETKAPDGYVAITTPIKFIIKDGSYNTTKIRATAIPNTKKGILPSTGGIGIALFLVGGAGLMAFALGKYKNLKDNEV